MDVIWDNRDSIRSAVSVTLQLYVYSLLLGSGLGLVFAVAKLSPILPLRWFASIYIWIFRGLPTLIVLFYAFYAIPSFGVLLSPMQAAVLGLGVSSSAYFAEIIRTGIIGVDSGQWEAAETLALSRGRTLRRIVLPQAIRIMIPAYMSNAITLLHATSLASVITVVELTGISNRLITATFRPLTILGAVGAMYVLLSALLVLLQVYLERAFRLKV